MTKISIFDQNFDFWPKFRFLTKILIFDQNFDFWPKFQFLTKISIFVQNFWSKFRFLTKIFDFYQNFRFLPKLSIFDQDFDFWPTFSIFDQNFRFVTKIFDFWPKFSIFDQNFWFLTKIFDFWPKFRFWPNLNFWLNFNFSYCDKIWKKIVTCVTITCWWSSPLIGLCLLCSRITSWILTLSSSSDSHGVDAGLGTIGWPISGLGIPGKPNNGLPFIIWAMAAGFSRIWGGRFWRILPRPLFNPNGENWAKIKNEILKCSEKLLKNVEIY